MNKSDSRIDLQFLELLHRALATSNLTLSTAESCTGGMIGEIITRAPGSSKYFKGGAIVYSNEEKMRALGVLETTLIEHGAVSQQTVIEMAMGLLRRIGTDFGVAVSGIAGPDGATATKPVGLVWVALAKKNIYNPTRAAVWTKKLNLSGDRQEIRSGTAWAALDMVSDVLEIETIVGSDEEEKPFDIAI